MFSRIKIFFGGISTLESLVIKNLRSKYSNTVLGFLWAVLTPLLISLVIAFVFTNVLQMKTENFVSYIISGMLPWMCFAGSLQESMNSLVGSAAFWRQYRVPLELITASYVVVNFIILIIGLVVAIPFFVKSSPKVMILFFWLPIPLALHFMFTLGLSLFLSSSYVKYKDISHILNIFLLFWLWVSPVFYLLNQIPLQAQRLSVFNIMIPFLNLYRSILYKGSFFNLSDLFSAAALAIASFLFGYYFFIKHENMVKKVL